MHRVLIAEKNRLLREMLSKALKAVTNLEIVYPTNSTEYLSEDIDRYDVDWIIVSSVNHHNWPVELMRVMAQYPDVGVLEVAPDGSPVRVKRLEIVEFDLDGVSLDELAEILAHNVSEIDQYAERNWGDLDGS